MNKLNRLLALVMALVMACGLCLGALAETTEATEPAAVEETAEPAAEEAAEPAAEEAAEPAAEEAAEPAAEEAAQEPADARMEGGMVYATSSFGQKFSPFFHTVVYDQEVVEQVVTGLLGNDRGGAIIQNGMDGETVNYNGTDYEYKTMGNVEIVMNDDGTVDYNLTMRDDIVFSDGVPATIDDVIFGIYVLCDPTYDGSSTLYAQPIEGMEEYRSGMQSLFNLLVAAGRDNTDFSKWDEATQTAFWADIDQAGAAFAQEIVDYCVANEYVAADATVAQAAAEWGFELAENATAADFYAAMVEAYEGDLAQLSDTEKADHTLFDLMENYNAYATGVETGEGAPNIKGIIRTGDHSMTIHMTEYNAKAIYEMNFYVAPMHYYGDAALYDYAGNSFGFPKGDLSIVKSKNNAPLGAGPYTFESYANNVVTLKANPSYYLGEPKVQYLQMQETLQEADYVPGIQTGSFDVAMPSISDDTVKAIKDGNSNGELTGDVITTVLVDYRGYGYMGINADLVNMNGEPASEESKALRKGFMTLFSVYRDTVIKSYYDDRASVIQYPISNTSWAAPKPADPGYHNAYSEDVLGMPIYDASMTEEQRFEAAKQAAIDFFIAAGLTYDEAAGKFTDVPQTYEVMIPGQGIQDHPAYGVAVKASEVLAELGITLQVNDVGTSVWNNALEGGTAMMWAAAWQADLDPDMTQVYSSENAHGKGTNYYQLDDPELDALIVAGRSSADTEERKSIYRDAMEIIMDWGCELPLYQRKDCTTFSTQRVDTATIPQDMTPFWNWYAEVQTLAIQ